MSQIPGLRVKVPMMVASILLSLSLWLMVQSTQPRGAQPMTIPLDYQNLDESLTITSIPEEVQARVEGTEEQLKRVRPNSMAAVVDLRDAVPGRGSYDVTLVKPRNMEGEVTLMRMTVPVEIERIVKRTLPVMVEPFGQIPAEADLVYQTSDVVPPKVTVTGPESQVRQVDKVRALLDLTQVSRANLELSVALEVVDAANRPLPQVEPDTRIARIRPGVASAPEMKGALVAPDFKGQPAFGAKVKEFSVTPNQVMIRGSSEALARISTVPTTPIMLDGLSTTKTFEVDVVPPDGVKWVNPRRVKVRVVIEPVPRDPFKKTQ